MTNAEIAQLLRKVSAAYLILGENRFRIIAYDRAADSIEHLTAEVKDYWDDKKLEEIPGVGGGIAMNLDELFTHGHSKHWDSVLSKVPAAVFPLLLVPGIGPKKAYTLVTHLKLDSEKTVIDDLEKAAKAGKIAVMEGFGEKSQSVILESLDIYRRGQIKERRMPLPQADEIAAEVGQYLVDGGKVIDIKTLGSLRRQVATIGDIDLAVSTRDPAHVLDRFVTFPHQRLVDRGTVGATLLLHNGRQVDLRVQSPEAFGAMLQYFTGSKHHNIQLRSRALEQGLSLSEHGIKVTKKGKKLTGKGVRYNKEKKLYEYETEEAFYKAIDLPYIPPELREDRGEIAAAAAGKIPNLVELSDMRGDLHVHTNYDLHPSHDLGSSSVEELWEHAEALGYEYIGFSDHNPKISGESDASIVRIMKKRKEYIEQRYSSWVQKVSKEKKTDLPAGRQVQYFLMCEVDIQPDGKLALPLEAMEYVDAVIVSIHSAFTQPKKDVTERIIRAITAHPKVRIFGHPTGRLLSSREGVDADWVRVFEVAQEHDVAIEINAAPERLDLPDHLVFDARARGLKFTIDTDAHAKESMDLMRYGVSVARRGWATKRDILNTFGYTEFTQWLERR